MKNILVFGSNGFIGRSLCKEAIKKFAVMCLDIDTIDVRLKEDWNYFKEYAPDSDYIYYFTAISDINQCNDNIENAFSVNVDGLIHLLERIKRKGVIFIFSSSVYVYNNHSGVYGITKRTAESIIKWYSENHGLDYRILRYGSVYGFGSGAIYRMIKEALQTGIISYYGTGDEVREYIHVDDVVKCSLDILSEKFKNKTLTIAGHYPMKASNLCSMIREILGGEYKIEFRGQTPAGHYVSTPYSYMPDISEKYIANTFYDLGAGLLDLINKIKEK